jgi:hypothetical protein
MSYPNLADPMPDLAPVACPNCQHSMSTPFCPNCGQRRVSGPYTWAEVRAEVVEKAFGLDQGLPRTFLDLTLRPGRMVADYLSGIRRRYASPIAYLAICMALYVGVVQLGNVGQLLREELVLTFETAEGQPYASLPPEEKADMDRIFDLQVGIMENYRTWGTLLVPVYAFGWWLAARWWRRQGPPRGFLETLILSIYLNAHATLLQGLATALALGAGAQGVYWASTINAPLLVFYLCWALKDFYPTSWPRAIAISLFGIFLSFAALLLPAILYGVYIAWQAHQ